MNNSSVFANFGKLKNFWESEEGRRGRGRRGGGGAPDGNLRPGRQKPSLRLCLNLIYLLIQEIFIGITC